MPTFPHSASLPAWLKILFQSLAFVLLLTFGILIGNREGWPVWYLLILLGGVFALTGWTIKSWGGLLGPHFPFDLIRLARRSRTRDVRVLYAFGLLVGLGLMYYTRFPHQTVERLFFQVGQSMSINEGANFASAFVFTIIVVQNLAVLILTPVYVGSAITEEKERRTLEMLFTTHLKDREIIFGKLASRIVHLGGVLLGGLPVLSLAQLWGGIDFQMLLANFINSGFNLLTIGSISILVSVICKKVVNSVLIIYGMVLPVGMCLGIFSLNGKTSMLGLAQSDMAGGPAVLWGAVAGFGMFHLLISISCLSVALVWLRGQRTLEEEIAASVPPPPPMPRLVRKEDAARRVIVPIEREPSLRTERAYELPPVHDDPLFWKEINLGRNPTLASPLFYTGLGLSVSFLALIFLGHFFDVGPQHETWFTRADRLGQVARVVCSMWAAVCVVSVAFVASGTVVRERQQQTLDALITLPVERWEILWAKWLGGMFRCWGWWLTFSVLVVASMAMTAFNLAGGMVLLAAGFVHGAFFASLGMVLSVMSRTVLSAYIRMALFLLILVPGIWVVAEAFGFRRENWLTRFVTIGINPVRTWYALGASWQEYFKDDGRFTKEFESCLAGLGVYSVLAGLLWLVAWRRFKDGDSGVA